MKRYSDIGKVILTVLLSFATVNPKGSVKHLIDWILWEEGQYMINETDYVGLG